MADVKAETEKKMGTADPPKKDHGKKANLDISSTRREAVSGPRPEHSAEVDVLASTLGDTNLEGSRAKGHVAEGHGKKTQRKKQGNSESVGSEDSESESGSDSDQDFDKGRKEGLRTPRSDSPPVSSDAEAGAADLVFRLGRAAMEFGSDVMKEIKKQEAGMSDESKSSSSGSGTSSDTDSDLEGSATGSRHHSEQ